MLLFHQQHQHLFCITLCLQTVVREEEVILIQSYGDFDDKLMLLLLIWHSFLLPAILWISLELPHSPETPSSNTDSSWFTAKRDFTLASFGLCERLLRFLQCLQRRWVQHRKRSQTEVKRKSRVKWRNGGWHNAILTNMTSKITMEKIKTSLTQYQQKPNIVIVIKYICEYGKNSNHHYFKEIVFTKYKKYPYSYLICPKASTCLSTKSWLLKSNIITTTFSILPIKGLQSQIKSYQTWIYN